MESQKDYSILLRKCEIKLNDLHKQFKFSTKQKSTIQYAICYCNSFISYSFLGFNFKETYQEKYGICKAYLIEKNVHCF